MVTAAMKLRYLLLGRKTMANLDSKLKSRDMTLLTKVFMVRVMVFPAVMYGCESWTRWILAGKVMSLLLNMLSRLVITFLPRSKYLNFMAAVTVCSEFGAQKIKSALFPHLFPMK